MKKNKLNHILVSVIVPIYGIERYLSDCIESVIAQTYKELQIILVDDGSPDACPTICDYYASLDDRIVVIHKNNGGLVSARKEGLKFASGDYVMYVDGDDWIEAELVERLILIACQTDADIVISGFKKDIEGRCTEHKNYIKVGSYDKDRIKDEVLPIMMFDKEHMSPAVYTYVWGKLFKKDILDKAQFGVPNKLTIGEDAACIYPAIIQSNSIAVTGVTYYHYRQRSMSMLKTGEESTKETIQKIRYLYNYLRSEVEKYSADKEYYEWQVREYVLYMLSSMTGGVLNSARNGLIPILYNLSKKEWSQARKIAVYGAGTMGQHLVSSIESDATHDVVCWVDPDYHKYKMHYLNVNPVEALCDDNYNILLVSILNAKDSLKNEIEMMGIDSNKIFTAGFDDINIEDVLRECYGVLE